MEGAEASARLLDREIVGAFFPPRVWASFYEVIAAGPVDTVERARRYSARGPRGRVFEPEGHDVSARGRKTTLANGGLSESPVQSMITAVFGLMDVLDELRVAEQRAASSALPAERRFYGGWTKADFPRRPSGSDLGAIPAATNRDAPSLRLTRLNLLCGSVRRSRP